MGTLKNITASMLVFIGATLYGNPDSVSMDALYSKQVFYQFENGVVLNADNENWNIGFSVKSTGAAGSSILLNEANSRLWAVPHDTSFWTSFDTTAYLTWDELLNSDTSWTNGAFNTYRGADGMFDLGWGILDPLNNYWTFGDSLYLIKLGSGSFKKLWIESLKTGVWKFKYANLDGSGETELEITKADYPNRNFIYCSLETGTIVDREPDASTWDITFIKHRDEVSPGVFTSVTSVFSNVGLWTSKSHELDYTSAISAFNPEPFSQNIINIGREWKYYSGGVWTVYDSIAYYAWSMDSSALYRIVFTHFEGMATGKVKFDIAKIGTAGYDVVNTPINCSVYPNPASASINIMFAEEGEHDYYLYNVAGVMVQNGKLDDQLSILDLQLLPNGMYLLKLENNTNAATIKIIVEH